MESESAREMPDDALAEAKSTDKGRRLLFAYCKARELGATHVMFLDADDLVSSRLSAFVSRCREENGWVMEKGYRYEEGSHRIYIKRRGFHRECGSGLIVRTDLVPAPEPDFEQGFEYYRFFINHQYQADKMKRRGHPLASLPFRGAVYVIHSANWYGQPQRPSRCVGGWLVKASKSLLNSKRITDRIRAEYTLYSLDRYGDNCSQ